MLKKLNIIYFFLLLLLVTGCGFQMRGAISLPEHLNTIRLLPNQPYDPFQRNLRQTLKLNGIQLVDQEASIAPTPQAATLTIVNQEFSERVTTYSADGQANQMTLKFKVTYQFSDKAGQLIIDNQTAEVERELISNPDAVLITDNERERLKTDLMVEAALQLVRHLSAIP